MPAGVRCVECLSKGDSYDMKEEAGRFFWGALRYVMKMHAATRLHYDLRLEFNGVLLSWAISKDLNCRAGIGHEAVEMDDHNLEHVLFEGVHLTGTIMVWDRGTWKPDPEYGDIRGSLSRGRLKFTLGGEKLKGTWLLIRTDSLKNAPRVTWILRKEADSFAESDTDPSICETDPNSILTGRTMEEIDEDWTTPRNRSDQQGTLFDGM